MMAVKPGTAPASAMALPVCVSVTGKAAPSQRKKGGKQEQSGAEVTVFFLGVYPLCGEGNAEKYFTASELPTADICVRFNGCDLSPGTCGAPPSEGCFYTLPLKNSKPEQLRSGKICPKSLTPNDCRMALACRKAIT